MNKKAHFNLPNCFSHSILRSVDWVAFLFDSAERISDCLHGKDELEKSSWRCEEKTATVKQTTYRKDWPSRLHVNINMLFLLQARIRAGFNEEPSETGKSTFWLWKCGLRILMTHCDICYRNWGKMWQFFFLKKCPIYVWYCTHSMFQKWKEIERIEDECGSNMFLSLSEKWHLSFTTRKLWKPEWPHRHPGASWEWDQISRRTAGSTHPQENPGAAQSPGSPFHDPHPCRWNHSQSNIDRFSDMKVWLCRPSLR